MKRCCMAIAVVIVILFAAGNALSQEPIIYPKEGQSQQQMEQDRFECYNWAKQQSGFDPMQAQAAAPPPESQQGESKTGRRLLKGGAGGAAVGAGIGALAGNAGKGAAAGALAGGAASGIKGSREERQSREQQQAQQTQQTQQIEQKREAYNRAFEACMEGRGYTVK